MNLIDAQALAALHAQQDADFGRLLAAFIFIALVVVLAYCRTDESRTDRWL
jgi:uncharacterized membrane-anchored protein